MVPNRQHIVSEISLHFGGIDFIASGQRVLFEPESKTLLVADCHIGKAAHFRKNHYPIPASAAHKDLETLAMLFDLYQPEHCVFMGDLFHSVHNAEWESFMQLISAFQFHFHLVLGNHDILHHDHYKEAGLSLHNHLLLNESIVLSHEPGDFAEMYNICGHVHPGIGIGARARQRMSFPCFCISGKRLYMPSFGNLTGHINMQKIEKHGEAWCIAQGGIINQPVAF